MWILLFVVSTGVKSSTAAIPSEIDLKAGGEDRRVKRLTLHRLKAAFGRKKDVQQI